MASLTQHQTTTMADDNAPYELEGGTEAYLRNVKRMEEAWWNQPGTDKTWVEETIRRFDEHYRMAKLVPLSRG